MRRYLLHGPAPWTKTGYGTQLGILARSLHEAGHDVTISSFAGLQGRSIDWEGIRVLGGTREAHGNDFIGHRMAEWLSHGFGYLIMIGDTWAFDSRALQGAPVAFWTPVDCNPMSVMDKAVIKQSGGIPLAIAKHGLEMMEAEGLGPLYMPHAIDTDLFSPGDRKEARKLLGFPEDAFIIGFNGANSESTPSRKALPQQLQAFARFRKTHPDAVMALNTRVDGPEGAVHCHELSERLGITGSLFYTDQIEYWQGNLPAEYVATFYRSINVLSGASFGEGFGLPLVEAQACGIPVITSRHSAMTEMCGAGWLVDGQPWWQNDHQAFWHDPSIDGIALAYNRAYAVAGGVEARPLSAKARRFALGYSIPTVQSDYWEPCLGILDIRLESAVEKLSGTVANAPQLDPEVPVSG